MVTLDANVWVAAFDPRDRFHRQSAALLRALAQRGTRIHAPAFMTLEASCALARRARDPALADAAFQKLQSHPSLVLHPVDEPSLARAREIGAAHLLRGADALYAATAALHAAPLVTWDDELVARAGAQTPDAWLTAQP